MTVAEKRAAYVCRLEEAVERIQTVLAEVPGMRRVSLFGSYARGRRDLFTDLDLFVVWDTDRPLLERQRYLYSLLSLPVDLDIVCYTPEELAAGADSPLNRHLLQEEVVLFESKPACDRAALARAGDGGSPLGGPPRRAGRLSHRLFSRPAGGRKGAEGVPLRRGRRDRPRPLGRATVRGDRPRSAVLQSRLASESPEDPLEIWPVDDSHDGHERLIDPVEHEIIARAKLIEGRADALELFDSRWNPSVAFGERAEVIGDGVAIDCRRYRLPREARGRPCDPPPPRPASCETSDCAPKQSPRDRFRRAR